MFRFAHPDFLYLLFILPVLIAFYVYAMILKKKAIKKYGNPELLAELMPEVSPKRQHLKFWLLFEPSQWLSLLLPDRSSAPSWKL